MCAGVSLSHRPADEMDAFLPSEIGRLIYGYLFQQCGEGLADEFLNTSDSMRECRLLKQKYAKNFHHKVQDLSLEDILNQYSVLCSLIFKQVNNEEPVHRNVLGLLKKVLSSRLLGLSSVSADRSRAAKPSDNKVDPLVGDESEASKSGASVTQSGLPANPADHVNGSIGDRFGASMVQLQPTANSADEDNAGFSSCASNAMEDYRMDVDDNDCDSEDAVEKDSVAKKSDPVVESPECRQKTISPNTESRICAILCNSATRQLAGMSNLPFPVEYCTPRKDPVMSASLSSTLPNTMLPKTSTSVADAAITVQTTVMKSIENVSKNLSSMAETGLATPKSGEQSSRKPVDGVTKKEKVLQRGNRSSSKTTKSSSIATSSTLAVSTTSSVTRSSAAKVNDQLLGTTPSISAAEVSPITSLVSLPRAPMPTVSSVYQTPRVSATPCPVTNVQGVPIMTSAEAIIPEKSTESVFGELSFESECSLPSGLDKSNSSVNSDGEVVGKLRRSPIRRSPRKAAASPVDSSLSARSGVTCEPILSTTRAAETTSQTRKQSTADSVVLLDSKGTASSGFQKKDSPWDINLRSFVDIDLPMDAHITKRKPKDLRSRKSKEVPKKRKHNDDPDDPLSTAKRFKPETVAAVSVGMATPRQPPLVCKSVDADKTVGLVLSPLRRRRATKDMVESTLGLEKKSDKNNRSKGGQEGKRTPEVSTRVKVGREGKRTPEIASTARSSTSMDDILDFGSPAKEKKMRRLEKVTAAEKKQQAVKKVDQNEIRAAPKARSYAKPANEIVINSTGTSKGRKKSERIDERVADKKKSQAVVDAKSATFKESGLHVEEKFSCPTETNKSRRKDAERETIVDEDVEDGEILEDHEQSSSIPEHQKQSSITTVETTVNDPVQDEEIPDFEMVLEISQEFVLFCRPPRFADS